MDKELVLHPEQGLVWKTVVENYEAADLGQLEGEVSRNQEELDGLVAQQEVLNGSIAEVTSKLEASKSYAERGRALVETQVVDAPTEDLGSEVLADTVAEY